MNETTGEETTDEPSSSSQVKLEELPDDILIEIFTYLDVSDQLKLSSASKRFPIICSAIKRRKLKVKDVVLSEEHTKPVQEWFEIPSFSTNLTELDVSNCTDIPSEILLIMILSCSRLKTLRTVNTNLSTDQIWKILYCLEDLEDFSCSLTHTLCFPDLDNYSKSIKLLKWYVEVPPATESFFIIRDIINQSADDIEELHIHILNDIQPGTLQRTDNTIKSPLEILKNRYSSTKMRKLSISSEIIEEYPQDVLEGLADLAISGSVYMQPWRICGFMQSLEQFGFVQWDNGFHNFAYLLPRDPNRIECRSQFVTFLIANGANQALPQYSAMGGMTVIHKWVPHDFPFLVTQDLIFTYLNQLNLTDFHFRNANAFWSFISSFPFLSRVALPGCCLPLDLKTKFAPDEYPADSRRPLDNELYSELHPTVFFETRGRNLPLIELDLRIDQCTQDCIGLREITMFKLGQKLSTPVQITLSLPGVTDLNFSHSLKYLRMLRIRQRTPKYCHQNYRHRFESLSCTYSARLSTMLSSLPELVALKLEHSKIDLNEKALWEALGNSAPLLRYLCIGKTNSENSDTENFDYDIELIYGSLEKLKYLRLFHLHHSVAKNAAELYRTIRNLPNKGPRYLHIDGVDQRGSLRIGRDFCLMHSYIARSAPQCRDEVWDDLML